jgi:hypothetical protein
VTRRRVTLVQALAFVQFCAGALAAPYDLHRATTFFLAGVLLLALADVAELRRRVTRLERRPIDRDEEFDRR